MSQSASSVVPNDVGSGVVASGDLESQNAAAWTSRSQRRSMNNNSKRDDAANLAQELATTSSWSETFLPQSYGTLPMNVTIVEREGPSQQTYNPPRDDLDPPPAYSKRPALHEIRSSPIEAPPQSNSSPSNMQNDSDDDVPADLQQGPSAYNSSNIEEPLLDGRQRRRRCDRSKRHRLRDWVRGGKDKKRKCIRLMAVLAVCSLISIVVLCFVQAAVSVGADWFRRPTKSSQTLVPTGPDYRHFDPTGDIRGLYKLYDRLELKSATGMIDIEIDPQPGDGPAYLLVSSDVGQVIVKVSPEYLSRRTRKYRSIYTEIRTFTGSISAEILLGNGGFAFIDSSLGNQVLNVLTYGVSSSGEPSNITTESTTGAQKISLNSLDRSSITELNARHHAAATGSLDITYPNTWFGEVHVMSTILGRAIVEGKNLDYNKQDDHEVVAYRGKADGRHLIEVVSDGTGIASFRC